MARGTTASSFAGPEILGEFMSGPARRDDRHTESNPRHQTALPTAIFSGVMNKPTKIAPPSGSIGQFYTDST
jgi:hypothetical protein